MASRYRLQAEVQTVFLQADALSAGVENDSSVSAARFLSYLFKMLLLVGVGNCLERHYLAKANTCQGLHW